MKFKLNDLSHEELVEQEMNRQNITREEAEKYWKEMYEASAENVRQHEEFMERWYINKDAENLLSKTIPDLEIKIRDFNKSYPDINKFNLAEYLRYILTNKTELDMNFVKYIFSLNINFNCITKKGVNAFCIGLILKNIELIKLFIDKGIEINKPIIYIVNKEKYLESQEYKYNFSHYTFQEEITIFPINFVLSSNSTENNIIFLLIENGLDLNVPIYNLNRLNIGLVNSPISIYEMVLKNNNIDLMNYLINHIKFNDTNDKLLKIAIEKYYIEIIELLLSHRKENNIFHADLSKIIKYKNLPLLKKLVEVGCQLTQEDSEFIPNTSYISICTEIDDESFNFELKLTEEDKNKYFKEYTYLEIAKYLLEKDVDPNLGHLNPLMQSLNIEESIQKLHFGYCINYKMANLLITYGADVNYSDIDGKSILMSACEAKNHYEYSINEKINLINLLIENGAKLNQKDENGNSVIMYIDDSNSEREVYTEEFTDDGRIKESMADLEIYSSENILRLLIQKGADINAKNNMGITPLMHYSLKGEDRLVKILLENGADINAKSEMTAFDLAKNEEIKNLIKNTKNNNPQKLVKILSNFTIDKPIKYTTHQWDFGELKKEYGDFDGYMNAVKNQFDKMKTELEELSPNLYKKIYTFLIEENPDEKYSWYNQTDINIGWSSLKGLKEYCNSGNNPFDFKVPKPIFIGRKQLATFGEVINLFKQEIEIRADFKNLEQIFLSQNIQLDLSAAKLNTRQFYTDTQKFSSVLIKIFDEMKKREDFKNIEVTTTELDDRSIEIKMIQIDSFANKNANDMFEEVNNGDFADIKESLKNLCDWSIESSFEDENFRVNFLHSNNVKDIEILETKPLGFTHILRFYK